MTLADIDKDFFLDDFVEVSSSEADIGSDEELLEQQQQNGNISSNRNLRTYKERDQNGDIIPFSNEELRKRSRAKEQHASSSSKKRRENGEKEEGDPEKARYSERSIGGASRRRKGTKKKNGALEEEESSEEVVDGVRRRKAKKDKRKAEVGDQDSESSYEIDQKTGIKTTKKKRARTLDKDHQNGDLEDVYTTEVSDGGTRTRKLKQRSKAGAGKKTVGFDEDSDSEGDPGDTRRRRRHRTQDHRGAKQEMSADASKRAFES